MQSLNVSEFTKNASQMYFQNSLAEVVRKLRNLSSGTESEAMEQFINDTKKEVGSSVQSVKVAAVQKATYFYMLGYNAAYASFNVIEVMADTVFANKRAGYVAACLTFSEDTDVIPLLTALLKRDLTSANQYEAGLALYCIASICTPDLAKDLVSDVVQLLNHPRNYVRKKAVLSLYKIFLQFPESLRPTYPKLKDKLDDNVEHPDNDPAVRGAVVCVLCELARRNPANFLGLAVPFYSMLSKVHSNWTLIKIVKVFGYFAPLEPRLGKKLVDPLTNLILTTGAKSVQYECLLAVASGMTKVSTLTALAAEKLRLFVEDRDQNLKFLGLEAMAKMVGDNPKALADQRETVMQCLDDPDTTVGRKALEVLRDLVTRKHFVATIEYMVDRCVREPADEDWSNAVILAVVETAQTNDYGLIEDFEWYLGVLLDLCLLNLTVYEHGGLIENELITILTRVNGARQYGVEVLSKMLDNPRLLKCDTRRSSQWRVLRAAAFACGEYPYYLREKLTTCKALLSEGVALLPASAQVACLSAVSKIVAFVEAPCRRHIELCNGEEENETVGEDHVMVEELKRSLLNNDSDTPTAAAKPAAEATGGWLLPFQRSVLPDVQERAAFLATWLSVAPSLGPKLYEEELLPVAAGVQEAMVAPDDVDFDKPFCDDVQALLPLTDSDADDAAGHSAGEDDDDDDDNDNDFGLAYRVEQQRRLERERREEVSAFYLKDPDEPGTDQRHNATSPGALLEDEEEASRGARPGTSFRRRDGAEATTRGAQKKKPHRMNRELVKPANYHGSPSSSGGTPLTSQGRGKRTKSPVEDEATRRLRNIDVTRALTADEKLPETVPYAKLLAHSSGGVREGGAGSVGHGAASAAGALESALPPVILGEEDLIRVQLFVDACKVKKDGFNLSCILELANLSSTSSLYDVVLACGECSAVFPPGSVRWQLAKGEEKGKRAGDEAVAAADTATEAAGDGTRLFLTSKQKSAVTARKEVLVILREMPSTLSEPIPLTLLFTKERKTRTLSLQLPLRYEYFAKSPNSFAAMTSAEFNGDVLGRALAASPVVSSFIRCSKTALMVSAPLLQRALRLTAVDVFRNAITLYGVIHGRKSLVDQAHVAVLLREAVEGKHNGVAVSVRTYHPALGEAIIHEIVDLIHSCSVS